MNIVITDQARDKLSELLKDNPDNKALRIYVAGIGWGGPSFGMALEEPKEDTLKYKVDGFDFVVDEGLDQTYGKFTIGYSNNFLRKGFTITPDRGGSNC